VTEAASHNPTTDNAQHKLVLIDGNSLLYRAFFALPPLTNAKGEVTNAAYGFTTMLFKILDEEQPDLIAIAFDLPTPTFRHERYPEYKATRQQMPDELGPQIGMAHEILDAMYIPIYSMEGYEADDIIGTLSLEAEQAGCRVLVVTGDLDELQLVSDKVSVMMTRRGITDTVVYDPDAVRERYGFPPEQLPDFRALRGDTSDNIPGVPGIGDKTASALVAKYGDLETILAHADEVKPPRIGGALAAYADLARRAKDLALIVRDLPIELDMEALQRRPPDTQRLTEIFRRLDFRTLLSRIESTRVPAKVSEEHRLIERVEGAARLARELMTAREFIIHLLAEPSPAMRAEVRGVCFLIEREPAVVLGDGGKLGALLAPLKAALESPSIAKVGHDLKRALILLARRGIALHGIAFDTMIASYLVNPARKHDLHSAVYDHLDGGAEAELSLGDWPSPGRAAAEVRQIRGLEEVLSRNLEQLELTKLYQELEIPLVPVLADMEQTGVAINVAALETLSSRLGQRAAELERDIHELAGEEFTIASPKQLRQVLFEKLGLPPDKSKRTKTGYSTDADVLAGLAEHAIVAKILEYREITKLKSTYVDALPRLINPETGRLHTSLNQAVTATGRLSSSDPNLQNIPIRTELGTEIRRAFIPGKPDHLLLSADYSQIELRILAHITGDENLIQVFREDEDLHLAAAMEIFGVDRDHVTHQMRAFAKMVNFGIPYGISDFRLAREMGIPIEEATRYVNRYFARFPKVREYVQDTPKLARAAGEVRTLFGRRRGLPELKTRAPALRAAAERMAINTPMQGTAADIIKLAMLHVHEQLAARRLSGKMILQVHDELLLEVPEAELRQTAALVEECMSSAFDLKVPLKVDAKAGPNWLEMKRVR
jgi:DNA polymerase-1